MRSSHFCLIVVTLLGLAGAGCSRAQVSPAAPLASAAAPAVFTDSPTLPPNTAAGTTVTRLPVDGSATLPVPSLLPTTQFPPPPATRPVAATPAAGEAATGAPPAAAPTPTLDCQDGLRYLSDLTIPDGTQVAPGEPVDKRWQVENSGSCNWDERYRLQRISGDKLGVDGEQALYPARSGTQAVIRILFTAPKDPGTYRSAWQAYDPQGQPFGDPIYIEILVAASNP